MIQTPCPNVNYDLVSCCGVGTSWARALGAAARSSHVIGRPRIRWCMGLAAAVNADCAT